MTGSGQRPWAWPPSSQPWPQRHCSPWGRGRLSQSGQLCLAAASSPLLAGARLRGSWLLGELRGLSPWPPAQGREDRAPRVRAPLPRGRLWAAQLRAGAGRGGLGSKASCCGASAEPLRHVVPVKQPVHMGLAPGFSAMFPSSSQNDAPPARGAVKVWLLLL